MEDIILIIHTLAAAVVIGLVMMQHGKGADAGASFGGASGSLFGVSGSSNLLSRMTAIFIAVFFCTSLILGYLASNKQTASVVKSNVETTQAVEKEAAPAVPTTDDIPK